MYTVYRTILQYGYANWLKTYIHFQILLICIPVAYELNRILIHFM
jgi:hypothetical protein